MKHVLSTLILVIVLFTCADAQTEKGTTLLGGGAFFQTFDGKSTFQVSPKVGYFILNDVVTGASFTYTTTKGASNWALGPFIRLYLFGNDHGKFITQIGVNVGGAKNSDTDFGFDVAGGYALFLNESIALEFLANYIKTGDTKGIFTLGAGFQIHYNR